MSVGKLRSREEFVSWYELQEVKISNWLIKVSQNEIAFSIDSHGNFAGCEVL